jgi:hypothetical protein
MISVRLRDRQGQDIRAPARCLDRVRPRRLSDGGAVLALNLVVVTSENAGAFFSESDTRIIDFRTLERLLRAGKNDPIYVSEGLARFGEWADECYEVAPVSWAFDDGRVTYDGVRIKKLMSFESVPDGDDTSL